MVILSLAIILLPCNYPVVVVFLFFLFFFAALAEPMTNFDEYIKKYKDLSINEQQSTSQDLHLTLDANITYEVESYSIDEDHEVNLHLETDSISGPMRTRRQVRGYT